MMPLTLSGRYAVSGGGSRAAGWEQEVKRLFSAGDEVLAAQWFRSRSRSEVLPVHGGT